MKNKAMLFFISIFFFHSLLLQASSSQMERDEADAEINEVSFQECERNVALKNCADKKFAQTFLLKQFIGSTVLILSLALLLEQIPMEIKMFFMAGSSFFVMLYLTEEDYQVECGKIENSILKSLYCSA